MASRGAVRIALPIRSLTVNKATLDSIGAGISTHHPSRQAVDSA
jgi:hypothetical protein